MENPKKRKWTFYLLLFAIYAVVNFVVSLFIDKHDLRYAIIDSLVGGVIFVGLWWLIERPRKNDKK